MSKSIKRSIAKRGVSPPIESMRFYKKRSSYLQQGDSISETKRRVVALLVFASLFFFSGCDQAVYDRGFKAGEKAGYETGRKIGYKNGHRAGYSSGESKGKAQGFAAGTATFVSKTFIPNLGLILSIALLATATSWLSVYYIVPRHRAKQAKYDAKHSIEKTRKQLKAKHQVTVRQEIKRLKANLKLEKHEQSLQGKLEKLFTEASVLLLTDSNRLVDELCNRQLKTIKEIDSAGELTTEERILLYPAAAADLKSPQPKDKSNVKK